MSWLFVVHRINLVPIVMIVPIVMAMVSGSFSSGMYMKVKYKYYIAHILDCFKGKCKGNGTRRGNGKCACHDGYTGESCNNCAVGYYESFRDENKLLCSICHVSCDATHGCTSAGPNGIYIHSVFIYRSN